MLGRRWRGLKERDLAVKGCHGNGACIMEKSIQSCTQGKVNHAITYIWIIKQVQIKQCAWKMHANLAPVKMKQKHSTINKQTS